ncbi:MAG: TonB family protein [Kiritimatiellae bacterium]|nr:TonB family protein [Kiritimatiellia bacterium]
MKGFGHNLRIVTVVHIIIVIGLSVMSGCRWLFRPKPKEVIPIEFTVEVAGELAQEPAPVVEPDPPPAPTPAPVPAPRPPDPPPKKPPRKKIETSQKRVRRGGSDRKPTLSAEEIQKLLDQGARPSDRTRIPDADARGFARVRAAFYEVWVQPSRAEVGGEAVETIIVLGTGGKVISGRISRPSGNAVLDNSVRRALNAVKQVTGLPSGFEKRHREISIAFRVE